MEIPNNGTDDATDWIQDQMNSGVCDIGSGTYRVTRSLRPVENLKMTLHPAARIVRDFASGSGWAGGLVATPDEPTPVNGVTIRGGTWSASSHEMTGNVFSLYGNDLTLADITIDRWAEGRAMFLGGDRIRVINPKITGSPAEANNGGIRVFSGSHFLCTGGYIESGDDCYQFVPAEGDHWSANHSIRFGMFANCIGHATAARLAIALVGEKLDCVIEDCAFRNLIGSGTRRTIVIEDRSVKRGRGLVRRIEATGLILEGRSTEPQLHEIRVAGAEDVLISGSITAANERIQRIHGNSQRVTIDVRHHSPIENS